MVQVLLPLSGMGSWIVVVSGALMSMHVLGINLAPLLTVGGISGIVVGLSAQALLGNMISGLNLVRCCITANDSHLMVFGLLQCLWHDCMHCGTMKGVLRLLLCLSDFKRGFYVLPQYLSRPFVVGEKIDVMTSSGGKVVSGFVEEVSPMRTHLRTDHWLSVMVPNKVAKHPVRRSSVSACMYNSCMSTCNISRDALSLHGFMWLNCKAPVAGAVRADNLQRVKNTGVEERAVLQQDARVPLHSLHPLHG